MEQKHLLIVDDDRVMSPLLEEYLTAKGFSTSLCHNAFDGYEKFKSLGADLCILDVKMPMKNGFTLAKEILEHSPDTPLLFLTSESEKEKRIEGLKLGADDYILKPFSMEELYLRVNIVLKRVYGFSSKQKNKNPIHQIGRYQFNSSTRELFFEETIETLSNIECELLKMFCDASEGIVEREDALRQIWKDEDMLRGRSLNVYVSKLRKYFSKDHNILFQNVHGVGYKMCVSNS